MIMQNKGNEANAGQRKTDIQHMLSTTQKTGKCDVCEEETTLAHSIGIKFIFIIFSKSKVTFHRYVLRIDSIKNEIIILL